MTVSLPTLLVQLSNVELQVAIAEEELRSVATSLNQCLELVPQPEVALGEVGVIGGDLTWVRDRVRVLCERLNDAGGGLND